MLAFSGLSRSVIFGYIQKANCYDDMSLYSMFLRPGQYFHPWIWAKCIHLDAMSGRSASALYTAQGTAVTSHISISISYFKYPKWVARQVMSNFLPLVSQRCRAAWNVWFFEKKPYLRIYSEVSWPLWMRDFSYDYLCAEGNIIYLEPLSLLSASALTTIFCLLIS